MTMHQQFLQNTETLPMTSHWNEECLNISLTQQLELGAIELIFVYFASVVDINSTDIKIKINARRRRRRRSTGHKKQRIIKPSLRRDVINKRFVQSITSTNLMGRWLLIISISNSSHYTTTEAILIRSIDSFYWRFLGRVNNGTWLKDSNKKTECGWSRSFFQNLI